jgi:hypothetical protein
MAEDEPELDEETRRILEERLATFDENAKNAVDAKQFLAEARRRLKERSREPEKLRRSYLPH